MRTYACYITRSIHSHVRFYDAVMCILALCVVITLLADTYLEPTDHLRDGMDWFDGFVWLVFTLDYVIRFLAAEDRFSFVRHNIVDLLAILPFHVLFQGMRAARLARLLLMLRAFAYLNRAYLRVSTVLKSNDFDHVLWFTFCVIFIGAMSISAIDDMSIGDALWWSFVTTTTVGYGDIAPSSLGGRLVAMFLMLVGIGFLSTLTGTISTFFIKKTSRSVEFADEEIKLAITSLERFAELSEPDLDEMHAMLIQLKRRQQQGQADK